MLPDLWLQSPDCLHPLFLFLGLSYSSQVMSLNWSSDHVVTLNKVLNDFHRVKFKVLHVLVMSPALASSPITPPIPIFCCLLFHAASLSLSVLLSFRVLSLLLPQCPCFPELSIFSLSYFTALPEQAHSHPLWRPGFPEALYTTQPAAHTSSVRPLSESASVSPLPQTRLLPK